MEAKTTKKVKQTLCLKLKSTTEVEIKYCRLKSTVKLKSTNIHCEIESNHCKIEINHFEIEIQLPVELKSTYCEIEITIM
jgi:hypothetical protein